MPAKLERVEPVLSVRDVAASTAFYERLGFAELFRALAAGLRIGVDLDRAASARALSGLLGEAVIL